MPISYTKINEGNGWTTQTSLGPTNLNHMEQGIKDACDAIDTECVQATDITPISAYELVSADVSTKAINDGNGVNIASQFASLSNSAKLEYLGNNNINMYANLELTDDSWATLPSGYNYGIVCFKTNNTCIVDQIYVSDIGKIVAHYKNPTSSDLGVVAFYFYAIHT